MPTSYYSAKVRRIISVFLIRSGGTAYKEVPKNLALARGILPYSDH